MRLRILGSIALLLLVAVSTWAQSPAQFCHLDCQYNSQAAQDSGRQAPEFNRFYAGSILSYPVFGSAQDFDLDLGLNVAGRFVLNIFDFGQSDRLNFLLYSNVAPAGNVARSSYNAVADEGAGVSFGLLSYYTSGDLERNSVTGIVDASFKTLDFGEVSLVSYKLAAGFDGTVTVPLPINVSGRAYYVTASNKENFSKLQAETPDAGYFGANATVILPVKNKIGFLVQGLFSEHGAPIYNAGVVIAAGIF